MSGPPAGGKGSRCSAGATQGNPANNAGNQCSGGGGCRHHAGARHGRQLVARTDAGAPRVPAAKPGLPADGKGGSCGKGTAQGNPASKAGSQCGGCSGYQHHACARHRGGGSR
eukprot:416090-Heterocapsa_arctica.AAC.1